jgi:hypothetical protein
MREINELGSGNTSKMTKLVIDYNFRRLSIGPCLHRYIEEKGRLIYVGRQATCELATLTNTLHKPNGEQSSPPHSLRPATRYQVDHLPKCRVCNSMLGNSTHFPEQLVSFSPAA